jgi:Phosphoserine phosphatase RsbU, N-terminal domain
VIRRFAETYGSVLNRYLREPDERGLYEAYELGRRALVQGVGLLELLTVHHEALAGVIAGSRASLDRETLALAARFAAETLASFEMVQRGAEEAARAAIEQEQTANVVRRLSTLLADHSLAHDDGASLEEMLHLVAEQARELTSADRCIIRVEPWAGGIVAADPPHLATGHVRPHAEACIVLEALDGRPLGALAIDREDRPFTGAELAVLQHLAQMAAGAIDRRLHYAV